MYFFNIVYPISSEDPYESYEEDQKEEKFYKLNTTRRLGGKSSCKKNERKDPIVYNSEIEARIKKDFGWW
jgi:hypothetical protein